jgi:hypothetical protein
MKPSKIYLALLSVPLLTLLEVLIVSNRIQADGHSVKNDSSFKVRMPSTRAMRALDWPTPATGIVTRQSGADERPARAEAASFTWIDGCFSASTQKPVLQYDPDQLLDNVRKHLGLKNDAALGRKLCVQAPVLSKVRHRRSPVSADLLISMHEESGLSIRDLRALMGDRRERFSPLVLEQA